MTKSKGILAPRAVWTDEQLELLRQLYPNHKTEDVATMIGRTTAQTYQKANALGLAKSAEYLASPAACRLRRGDGVGSEYRFQKGIVPWNKGTKGLVTGGEATQFRPGQKPANYKPIGSERLSKEGYVHRKMTETGYPPRDWVPVHTMLWEQHNGPVPAKHRIAFIDGNKKNIVIENLECVSFAEMMRRNTIHNMPKELAQLVQLRGALNRQINKRSTK